MFQRLVFVYVRWLQGSGAGLDGPFFTVLESKHLHPTSTGLRPRRMGDDRRSFFWRDRSEAS